MSQFLTTLRARLLAGHLAVVAVGVIVLIVAGRQLSSAFVHDHLSSMGQMMMGADPAATVAFEDGVRDAFNRALWWGAAISAAIATLAATLAAQRVLTPLEQVRSMTKRLASGSYNERIPLPRERELAALAGDVNTLAASLQQTEARRLRLVDEVAHELRTPLATIKGYLEGVLDGVFEPNEEILAAAIGEVTRMERLSSDLSALSRSEEGRTDLAVQPVDIATAIRQVTDRLAPQFDDNKVGLKVGKLPDHTIDADVDRLSQILTNLIGNALAYTPAGGSVTIDAEVTPGSGTEVSVADNGKGLTSEQLDAVFERFYRADRSATGGSGIGLTIARNLARLHGGDITAISGGLGRGSTFRLTLPSAPPDL